MFTLGPMNSRGPSAAVFLIWTDHATDKVWKSAVGMPELKKPISYNEKNRIRTPSDAFIKTCAAWQFTIRSMLADEKIAEREDGAGK